MNFWQQQLPVLFTVNLMGYSLQRMQIIEQQHVVDCECSALDYKRMCYLGIVPYLGQDGGR